MKKILSLIGKTLVALLLVVLAVASAGHLFVPVYDFAPPRPFEGDNLYTPYAGVDFGDAKKAVFHFHTTLSDGHDAPQAIVGAYRDMGYEIVSVADHDRVTPAGIAPGRELHTYEHGLNVQRSHNVVFGARRTELLQLPLWQGVSGREATMRRLSERFPLVVLNHPAGVRGLMPRQMECLSHYDYIEADRSMDSALPLWDVALSAGHYSRVMAGDDLHDLSRPHAIGRAMTFVMTPSVDSAAVMAALVAGHTYAVRMTRPSQNPDSLYIPRVKAFDVAGDTIRVAFTDPALIRFVGQGGAVLSEVEGAREASRVFGREDSYVRVEARFGDLPGGLSGGRGAATIYLNPVARFSPATGDEPLNTSLSVRNLPLTILSVAGYALLILACAAGIYLLLFRRRKRKPRRMERRR
jgi:hypothetical protein